LYITNRTIFSLSVLLSYFFVVPEFFLIDM